MSEVSARGGWRLSQGACQTDTAVDDGFGGFCHEFGTMTAADASRSPGEGGGPSGIRQISNILHSALVTEILQHRKKFYCRIAAFSKRYIS